MFLSGEAVFAGLNPLDWATSQATMHPRYLGIKALVALQLQKYLCKRKEMRQLVVMVREMGDAICNDTVNSEDLVGIDPHRVVDYKAAL